MSRDIRIQPILDDLAELKELLLVIDQTPSTPEILYKLAGEKAQALTDAIFLLHHDVKQKVSEQKDNGVKESRDVEVSVIPDLGYPEEPVIDDEEVELYLMNAKAPCFIKDETESYIYLILPVNFNSI